MKLILHVLLILIIVSTISICTMKPVMHKSVIVYDSAYTLIPKQEVKIETEEIPIMEKPATPIQKTVQKEQTVVPETKTIKKQEAIKAQTQTKTPKTVQQKQDTNINKVINKTNISNTVQTPKVIQTTQSTKAQEPKVLTEQEEIIAWNIWRSNLTNKIMQDTRLPMLPAGIVFRFSFTVDKYGKISNVQTWSETSTYTPYAIQYIAPVIRSYQGRDILNFPKGTQRFSTEAKGGWKISVTEKYSTPQDYNDLEKVKNQTIR